MALPPPGDVLERLLAGSARVTRRVDIFDSSGFILPDAGVLDGSISVDITRDERRTLDITLADDEGRLEPGVDGLWYDKFIRPWRGIEWRGGSWEKPLGTFMIDNVGDATRIKRRGRKRSGENDFVTDPETEFLLSVQVSGRDLTKKMITSQLPYTVTFVANTPIDTIIRAEAALAGISDIQLPWSSTLLAPVLAIDQTFEADTPRWQIIKTLCDNYGYEVFFDVLGVLIVRLYGDPTLNPVSWVFEAGNEGNLINYVKAINDSELYNHIVVRGSNETNALIFGEASITDPDSPIHPDRIGDRTKPIQSSTVASSQDAIALAKMYLKIYALESYEVTLGSLVFPWLEGGDVVGFIDRQAPSTGDPTSYLLTNFTIPLSLGTMSGTGKRVRAVV